MEEEEDDGKEGGVRRVGGLEDEDDEDEKGASPTEAKAARGTVAGDCRFLGRGGAIASVVVVA